jgi:RNA polymerase sigma factor (TIGR02999 family)
VTSPDDDITRLLQAWSDGDDEALERLVPLVFEDLHKLARYFFQRESETHTLQPTALVSEVYFRLRGQKEMRWESRADFFNFAADLMRHCLVDYARRRKARKRGGDQIQLPLTASLGLATETDLDLISLHEALEDLAEVDERQSQIVKLKYFVGLKVEEIAEILDVSDSTVKREWRLAKFWLRRRLKSSDRVSTPSEPSAS